MSHILNVVRFKGLRMKENKSYFTAILYRSPNYLELVGLFHMQFWQCCESNQKEVPGYLVLVRKHGLNHFQGLKILDSDFFL